MNWKKGFCVFTQWMFIISICWFTVGLVIIGSVHWWILVTVPVVGLVALGYIVDFTRGNHEERRG